MNRTVLKKWLRRGFHIVLIIFSLLCTSMVLIAGTPAGSRWLVYQILNKTDQLLSVGSIDGTLLRGLSVQAIRYNDDTSTLSVQDATFRWQALTLFAGRLSITSLQATGIQFELHTNVISKTENKKPIFSMPITVSLDDAQLRDIKITITDSSITLDGVSLNGYLDSNGVTIKQISVTEKAISLSLRGHIDIEEPNIFDVVVDWQYQHEVEKKFVGQLRARGDFVRIMLEHDLHLPLKVSTVGEITLGGKTPRAILTGSSETIQWPLHSEQPAIKTDSVTATVEGWLDGYEIIADADFNGAHLPSSHLHVQATGNLEQLDIVSMLVTSIDNTLNAKGHGLITLAPDPGIDAALDVSLGKNKLDLRGKVSQAMDFSWRVNAPELNNFWPALAGKLAGQGTVKGELLKPDITGELSGNQIRYEKYSLQSFKLQAQGAASKAHITFKAEKIRLSDNIINHIELKMSGLLEQHQFQVTAEHDKLSFSGNFKGGYRDGLWDGQLTDGQLASDWFGRWKSTSPFNIEIASSNITVEQNCWQQNSASLCFQNHWQQSDGITAEAQLHALPLEILNKMLPESNRLRGLLDAKLTASGSMQELQLKLDAGAPHGAIIIAVENNEFETHEWNTLSLQTIANANTWQIKSEMQLKQPGYINVDLVISPQQDLDGQINVELENIAWLDMFTPRLKNLGGQIKIGSRIGGTLQQPEYELKGSLHNGYAELSDLGIALRNIELRANSVNKKSIALNGELESGEGHVALNGQFTWPSLKEWVLDLKVKGQNFEVVKLPVIQAAISPDLSIKADFKQMNITGTVLVQKADIEIKTLPASAVTISKDAIVIYPDQIVSGNKNRYDIISDIKLTLGKDVHFQGLGFDASLDGALSILEKPDQQTQTFGELQIRDGRYKAYGQTLKISQGKLIFIGPYDNPALAIRAERKTPDVTVGLEIGGTLKKPHSKIYSEPSLPDGEAMAILLTGKSMSSASKADGSMLIQAVLSLGVERGPAIAEQLARTFKLDVVSLDSESDFYQSSLLLGKYLTPRLYIRYAVGLFDQSNSVGLEYKLNNNFKLEAQSGTDQSMDLIYRIER